MYNPVKVLSQSNESAPSDHVMEMESSLPSSSSTSEDTNSQSSLVATDSNTANTTPDTANSVPDSTSSIPDTVKSIQDTTDSIPDTKVIDSELIPHVEPNVEPVAITPDSVSDTTNPDPVLETANQETEFVDYMNKPDPIEPASISERRAADPRKAATSFNISGADPIASSGDHAIDSDDVIVIPEATEDSEVEISHLVHDWIDKVHQSMIYNSRTSDISLLMLTYTIPTLI